MKKQKTLNIVPFSHLDLFWAGTRAETLSRGNVIIRTALDLLGKYPDYRFMVEAVNFMEYYIDSFPEETERVKRLIHSGHLELLPMRAVTYTQLPAGETLVRNLLYGEVFCREKFDFIPSVMGMSDIPGFTPQLPQIAVLAGKNCLMLSHGCPPHTDCIIYAALDGTEIRAYAPIHYARCRTSLARGEVYEEMEEKAEEFEENFKDSDEEQICQWGMDLCVIRENVVKNIMRWNKSGRRKLIFSTYSEFFNKHFPDSPKKISGEIPMLWPNVESSWPDIWPLDIPCENALFNAEFFGVLINNMRMYPFSVIHKAWIQLLDAMDHNQNGIGGAEGDKDKLDLKLCAKLTAEMVAKDLARVIVAKTTAPHENAFPIVVFNPLGWQRSELVKGRTTVYGMAQPGYLSEQGLSFHLIDGNGNEVPFSIDSHLVGVADSISLEFFAEDIPAFGAKVYYIESGEAQKFNTAFTIIDGIERDKVYPNCHAGYNSYENRFFKLEIDRVSGELTLFDKVANRYLFKQSGLIAYEEKRGDYIFNMDLTGRIIPAVLDSIKLMDHNAVFCRILLSGTLYAQPFTQTITIYAEKPVIDLENRINWLGGRFVRLEQAFPFVSDENAKIRYGVPFGQVEYPETIYKNGLSFKDVVTPERGNNPDHAIEQIRMVSKWTYIGDSRSGVSIGTDHRMWEFDRNTISNCMLRGIGQCSGAIRKESDGTSTGIMRPPVGEYTFHYRIISENTNKIPDGRVGWELNTPLYTVGAGVAEPSTQPGLVLPKMPDSSGTSVIIANTKPAEDKSGSIVFRCFETIGETAELILPEVNGNYWVESDILEQNRVTCHNNKLPFRPFEIKTLILIMNNNPKSMQ